MSDEKKSKQDLSGLIFQRCLLGFFFFFFFFFENLFEDLILIYKLIYILCVVIYFLETMIRIFPIYQNFQCVHMLSEDLNFGHCPLHSQTLILIE